MDYCCRTAWTYSAGAPIFSAPAVTAAHFSVIVAAVNGTVTALTCQGQQLWQCSLHAQVFAPLCLTQVPVIIAAAAKAMANKTDLESGSSTPASAQDAGFLVPATDSETPDSAAHVASAHEQSRHSAAADSTQGRETKIPSRQAKMRFAMQPAQEAAGAAAAEAAIVVGDANGYLHCIMCSTGQQLWCKLMQSSISTAAAILPTAWLSHTRFKPSSNTSERSRHHKDCPQLPEDSTGPLQAPRLAQQHPEGVASNLHHAQSTAHEPSQAHSAAGGNMQTCRSTPLKAESQTQPSAIGAPTLVSCTNRGAVRVLSLSDDHHHLTCARSATASGHQAQVQRTSDNADGLGYCMPTVLAAVQMPGDS